MRVQELRDEVKAQNEEVNNMQKKKKQLDLKLEEAKESIKYANAE